MNLVIHPSTQTQSYVFGANLHVKPLQAVSLSEFALRLFSLVCLGNMVEIPCQDRHLQQKLPKLTV